jgi:uncharacterized protein YwgA
MASVQQLFWDHVFLLNLFKCSAEPLDNLKIQKMVFLSEVEGRARNFATANFPFFRYHFGPYSKVAANLVRKLEVFGFVDPEFHQPSERGEYVLDYVQEFIRQSPRAVEALEILHAMCEKYRDTKSSALVDIVYGMKVSVIGMGGRVMTVRDIPECVDIIVPAEEKLETFIPFPKDLLDDLATEFSLRPNDLDPNNPANIKLAREAMSKALSA